jgi:hypothetical protein
VASWGRPDSSHADYIFSAGSGSIKDFLGQADPAYVLSPRAVGHLSNVHRVAFDVYLVESAASAVVVGATCGDIGRFRRGDMVPVELRLPYIPDQAPVAVVLDSDQVVIAAFSMPRDINSPGLFSLDLMVDRNYALGHHQLVFSVLAGGNRDEQRDQCFTVIDGGDAGGSVISLVCYQRGKIQNLLAHLANGDLVLGKNPSLDDSSPVRLPTAGDYFGFRERQLVVGAASSYTGRATAIEALSLSQMGQILELGLGGTDFVRWGYGHSMVVALSRVGQILELGLGGTDFVRLGYGHFQVGPLSRFGQLFELGLGGTDFVRWGYGHP